MAMVKAPVSVYAGSAKKPNENIATAPATTPTGTPATKTNEELATEVISGKWGNGADRKNQLTSAGYDYAAVQQIVDNRLSQTPASTPSTPAQTAPGSVTPETPAVTTPETPVVNTPVPVVSGADLAAQWKEQMPNVDPDALVNLQKVNLPSAADSKANQQAWLEQWKADVLAQSNNQIDHAVSQGVTELERAQADAQSQFKEQQESIAKDEAQAKDNAALYAEARGDKGGIGQEQYNSIMNTAAQNRLSVQQAQTKLATDTQRQIADLRAQGEFDKADKALEISQQYLSQLITLEQWAFDAGMTVAQFKASLDQWAADYKMAMAQFTTGLDQWAAEFDYNHQQNTNSSLANAGAALLEAGIMPSASQLAAMHMTSAQAQEYIAAAKLAAQTSGGGYTGGGSYNNTGGGDKWASVVDWVNKYGEDAAEDYIKEHYKDLGYSSQSAALSGWNNYLLSSNVEIEYNGGYAETITPPDYETIRRNSEAGLYGPKFAVVLTMVQAQWSAKKTNEEIAEYLNAELDKGSINEYGAAAIMQALGIS